MGIFEEEHYKIARGLNQAVKLLETTLGEEKKTDGTLTKRPQSEVNRHAQAV